MEKRARFGDYVQEVRVRQRKVSYNTLVSAASEERDSDGTGRQGKVELRSVDVVRLVRPYVSTRLADQIKAVLPLAAYLFLFQLLILRRYVENSWQILGGLLAVILGLMLFMEGLRVGLMPFGETIGNQLPKRSPLPVVLLIAFLLGIGVTFAEPAIGALQTAGAVVDVASAPYLYALLNQWAGTLVLIVGAGVGLAAVLGTLRFLNGWSLKPLIFAVLVPTVIISAWAMFDEHMGSLLGLAWDCGAVTTGPVTVPLVLSLGVGIASAAGTGQSSLSGFGIVTLASLFPVLGVLLLGIYVTRTVGVDEIVASAAAISGASGDPGWYSMTPWSEIILGVRAIVPLILFLFAILYFIVRDRVRDKLQTGYGLTIVVIGMIIFNLGLTYGLAALGGQSGALVPAAFTDLPGVDGSPLYTIVVGIAIAILFAWFLGFGATLAEPALNALGLTVEDLTNGVFRKSMLMNAVSIGVGFGLALGVVKIIYGFSIAWMLVPGYALALLLTAISTEEYVNVAWDSAGVTTGPVTVPLVLAMGLGFGQAVGAVEGFGILAMASICPILAVLLTGLLVQYRVRRRHIETESEMEEPAAAAI